MRRARESALFRKIIMDERACALVGCGTARLPRHVAEGPAANRAAGWARSGAHAHLQRSFDKTVPRVVVAR